eukprot:2214714-Pleurochrysis_carterae.AAC.3
MAFETLETQTEETHTTEQLPHFPLLVSLRKRTLKGNTFGAKLLRCAHPLADAAAPLGFTLTRMAAGRRENP